MCRGIIHDDWRVTLRLATIASWLFYCLCCLSGADQQLMLVLNVVFWNQVIRANQFCFLVLRFAEESYTGMRLSWKFDRDW